MRDWGGLRGIGRACDGSSDGEGKCACVHQGAGGVQTCYNRLSVVLNGEFFCLRIGQKKKMAKSSLPYWGQLDFGSTCVSTDVSPATKGRVPGPHRLDRVFQPGWLLATVVTVAQSKE
jgi:hypothetical protein